MVTGNAAKVAKVHHLCATRGWLLSNSDQDRERERERNTALVDIAVQSFFFYKWKRNGAGFLSTYYDI